MRVPPLSAAAAALVLLSSAPAAAAVRLLTTQTNDFAFEGPSGWLDNRYGPLTVVGTGAGATVLPPLERAVAESRIGRANNSERTRGFHVPQAATGIPGVANAPVPGRPPEGVFQALTNAGSLAPSSITTAWVSGAPVAFELGRAGTTVFYRIGATGPGTWANSWSETKSYYADINAFELRIRSNTPAANSSNALAINNLVFDDAAPGTQSLGSFGASNGELLINLWDRVSGDFTVTGSYVFTFTGTRPGASAVASQLKLLALPAVPEPSTWALLVAGFGLVGAVLRRRRDRHTPLGGPLVA